MGNREILQMSKTISELSEQINENAHAKGFWDEGVDIPQKLMLIVSEVAEAMEADRKDRYSSRGFVDYISKVHDEAFNPIEFEVGIKDTYEDELADVAIRLFDLAKEQGINLQAHIELKMKYNATRPHMHGGKKY